MLLQAPPAEREALSGLLIRVADAIGGSSQTMEEAYLTAVRVRRAEQRARTLLKEIAAQALAQRAPSSADD